MKIKSFPIHQLMIIDGAMKSLIQYEKDKVYYGKEKVEKAVKISKCTLWSYRDLLHLTDDELSAAEIKYCKLD